MSGEPLGKRAIVIRIDLGNEIKPGIFEYRIPSLRVEGRSRQPLLDACRRIRSILGPTAEFAGLFREGRTQWDLRCPVNVGAELTVSERSAGGIRFEGFREFDRTALSEAAE